ncbi:MULTISPECIES: hypothetical protein [unclassified Pseudoalteromonas]|uniref:hypothetical protein n=1 Tax=unclassified Pseudoalteromonas TaxID=194690 RepID=UPI0020977A37|nr:hypothetical protein [Pseudoalteromonas sp. XMcav2-N]MCO7189552.1 hypothetical protein [Pseudoalteromonas sp. XMcav2-N]
MYTPQTETKKTINTNFKLIGLKKAMKSHPTSVKKKLNKCKGMTVDNKYNIQNAGTAFPIQRMKITLTKGKLKLPRIYMNSIEPENYIVADLIQDFDDYYVEINRMCNAMSILWAKTWGDEGNVGFWDFTEEDQKTMAVWAATDLEPISQAERVSTELEASEIGIDNLGRLLETLDGTDLVRGVLANDVHAVAIVIKDNNVQIYDPMEGEVIIEQSLADFIEQFNTYAETYKWDSAIINSPTQSA